MRKCLFVHLLLLLCISSKGYDAAIGGIYYDFDIAERTATVTYGDSKYAGDIVIPESVIYDGNVYNVKFIGNSAFDLCWESLTSVTIPNSIVSIGRNAFCGCEDLQTVNMGNGVESIGWGAFYGCSMLKSIFIPKGVKNLEYLFRGCNSLERIVVDGENPIYDCGEDCNAIIETLSGRLLEGCKTTTIPNSVKEIAFGAFAARWELASISIPNSVEKIEEEAFAYCYGLSSVSLGEGVVSIMGDAFRDCTALKNVYCNSSEPPIADLTSFSGVSLSSVTLHVPAASLDFYKETGPWKDFGKIISMKPTNTSFNGKCYLLNLASGGYLGAGNSWGLRASLVEHPEFVKLQQLPDGVYSLQTQVNSGDESYYFDGDYMDSTSPMALYINKTEDGCYTVANESIYYGYDGVSTILGKSETNPILPNVQWKIYTEDEMIAHLADATPESPVDATFLIQDANLGRYNMYYKEWKWDFPGEENYNNSGDYSNFCAESWHVAFTFSQTLTDIPNGLYSLTAQGFYVQDGTDELNLPVFFANDATRVFPVRMGGEGNMSDASLAFSDGLYTIEPIYTEVTDGTLHLGATLMNNTNLWCVWDNFVLTYYGPPLRECTLQDGEEYVNGEEMTVDAVAYTRTFNNVEWQALYVPFAMEYRDWAEDFDVARISTIKEEDTDEDGVVDATKMMVEKLSAGDATEANKPYLIRAKSVGQKTIHRAKTILYANKEKSLTISTETRHFTFTGTYKGLDGIVMYDNGFYGMGGGSLHQAESTENSLGTYRWYMSVTDLYGNPADLGEVKVMVFDEETGIDDTEHIENTEGMEGVYDLSGRRVTHTGKGIYMKNGRKYVVR